MQSPVDDEQGEKNSREREYLSKFPEGERSLSIEEEKERASGVACKVGKSWERKGRLDVEGLLENGKT